MDFEYAILDNYLDISVQKDIRADIDNFMNTGGGHCDISRYAESSVLLKETEVIKDERECGYLVRSNDVDEEIIVSLTGVLVEADLPPYKDMNSLYRTRPNKKDIPVNRVSLAFFGHDNYDAARVGLENVRSTFSRFYASVDKIKVSAKVGMPIISCENRVVSKVDHVPVDVRDAKLPKAHDPNGIIRKNLLMSNKHRFVDDNAVTFSKLAKTTENDAIEIIDCSPEEFKIGMIVCVQATPTVVPTTKNGSKLILKLRSILHVSDAVYKRFLFTCRVADIDALPKPGSGLKRKAPAALWINSKKRSMTIGDVEVRERSDGGSRKDASSEADKVAARFGRMTTKEGEVTSEGESPAA
ncbi:hypothetical protein PENSPDRAFT_694075 [Peniophora sp. CONT]|nr:hypothetical protein PENSPDRAFT_694075 [Peniophora sp. CONT]